MNSYRNKPAFNSVATSNKLNTMPTLRTPLPLIPFVNILKSDIVFIIVHLPTLFTRIPIMPWNLTHETIRLLTLMTHTSLQIILLPTFIQNKTRALDVRAINLVYN